jgi:4-diphosphocytidyl-2-C-methyl-D-erythritol kinase
MAGSVRVRAAAKVNLHLRVYGRRADGFHSILSLFQAVSLADSIVIRSLKEFDTIEIDGDFDCPPRFTTVFKAAQAYRAATGIRTGLGISVDKKIPAGAGLGGGSSDAAAILTGLEALLRGGLDATTIGDLGASIGSDVPFFLSAAAAFVSGRGEIVDPIAARDDFSLVIACPGFSISTAEAYSCLDVERPDGSAEPDPGREELDLAYKGDIRQWPFANSFEKVIGRTRPEILEAKNLITSAGAAFASMSGSGSAIYGVFEDERTERTAIIGLQAAGFSTFAVSPLARCSTLD